MSRLGNIGILLIGAALCIWAYTLATRPTEVEEIKPDYQIAQLGDMARNQFLIDKNNGRIWQRKCFGKIDGINGINCDGEEIWQEMYIENLSPPFSPIANKWNLISGTVTPDSRKNSGPQK